MDKAQDRLEILQKITEYERDGKFDVDVEADPPSREIKPNEVDYLNKKLSSKIMTAISNKVGRKYIQSLINSGKLVIDKIVGLENLENLTTGAVITSNHICFMDSFLMQLAYEKTHFYKKKKLYKIIREGNYTSMTGLFGLLLRHCNTLPLSSNAKTMVNFMRATKKVLSEGNLVLIYPEQSMWWYYKKPKPLKEGAFKFAVKSNVPILPTFITMENSDTLDDNGFLIQKLTLHIEKPIYSNPDLSDKQNIENMKNQNFKVWKNIYEKTYDTKLDYTTINRSKVQKLLDM